jgi:hypothetical protein
MAKVKKNQWAERYANRNFPNWNAKRKTWEKKQNSQKLDDNYKYKRYNVSVVEIVEEEKGRNRKKIWRNNDWQFSKINGRKQSTNPRFSESTKQDK